MASAITSIGVVGECWHLSGGRRPGEEPPIGLILCGREEPGADRAIAAGPGRDQGGVHGGSALQGELDVKLGYRLSQLLLRHTFLTRALIQHKNVFKPEISLLVIKDLKIDSSTFKWNF